MKRLFEIAVSTALGIMALNAAVHAQARTIPGEMKVVTGTVERDRPQDAHAGHQDGQGLRGNRRPRERQGLRQRERGRQAEPAGTTTTSS